MITNRYKLLVLFVFIVLIISFIPLISVAEDTHAQEIIKTLHLKPLPHEGGYFKQTYALCISKRCKATYQYDATAIYYLLVGTQKSIFHKLQYDEIYHFYTGQPITLIQLRPNGDVRIIKLGNKVLDHEQPQVLVPKQTWQASFITRGKGYALLGTTMTPGFNGEIIGKRDFLLKHYPAAKRWIMKLTKK